MAKAIEKSAAVLTIVDAPLMTARGRKAIAAWLRRHADMLIKEGRNYAPGRFRGRYLYSASASRAHGRGAGGR